MQDRALIDASIDRASSRPARRTGTANPDKVVGLRYIVRQPTGAGHRDQRVCANRQVQVLDDGRRGAIGIERRTELGAVRQHELLRPGK